MKSMAESAHLSGTDEDLRDFESLRGGENVSTFASNARISLGGMNHFALKFSGMALYNNFIRFLSCIFFLVPFFFF